MKIGCACGAVIVDSTDYLPHKGHLIPDQNWFDTFDAIDAEVIDRLAAGQITKEEAYWQARLVMGRSVRMVYECRECGRLYVDDRERNLQSYISENKNSRKVLLRNKDSERESGGA